MQSSIDERHVAGRLALSRDVTASARSVRISALALLKMAMHAKSGGNIEVMGMLQACSLPPVARGI